MISSPRVLLGSILLEPNRWAPGKPPSFRVSDYARRIKLAGFDGLELWENHAALAHGDELERLRGATGAGAGLPVEVFNSYCGFRETDGSSHERVARLVRVLGATAIKWNFGNDIARADEEIEGARRLANLLPEGVRLLCECHPGTIAETPETASGLLERLGPAARFQAIVHSAVGAEPLQRWFAALGPRITHVHAVLYAQPRVASDAPPDRVDGVRVCHDLGLDSIRTYTLEFTRGIGTATDKPDDMLLNAARDLKLLRDALRG